MKNLLAILLSFGLLFAAQGQQQEHQKPHKQVVKKAKVHKKINK